MCLPLDFKKPQLIWLKRKSRRRHTKKKQKTVPAHQWFMTPISQWASPPPSQSSPNIDLVKKKKKKISIISHPRHATVNVNQSLVVLVVSWLAASLDQLSEHQQLLRCSVPAVGSAPSGWMQYCRLTSTLFNSIRILSRFYFCMVVVPVVFDALNRGRRLPSPPNSRKAGTFWLALRCLCIPNKFHQMSPSFAESDNCILFFPCCWLVLTEVNPPVGCVWKTCGSWKKNVARCLKLFLPETAGRNLYSHFTKQTTHC